jgi:hypothetical protein
MPHVVSRCFEASLRGGSPDSDPVIPDASLIRGPACRNHGEFSTQTICVGNHGSFLRNFSTSTVINFDRDDRMNSPYGRIASRAKGGNIPDRLPA